MRLALVFWCIEDCPPYFSRVKGFRAITDKTSGFDAAGLWRVRAPGLEHTTVTCRRFMAEEAAADVVGGLRSLLAG
ncbi:hypothetical protein ACFVYE_23555 [Streptomyces sp. NPDC058239]|uniref:hypothetical protein n=1 Tax=unclassified Streptomyces TaxID=2593676 RepID=UPI0036559280